MSALQDLLTEHVGRGRPISVEQVAREGDVGERSVHRWLEGESEPTVQAFRNMLASTILAADFRRALADYLFQRCIDLRAVLIPPAHGDPHPNPLRLSFDGSTAFVELQRALEKALHELGDGGADITESEQAEIEARAGEIERLIPEVRRAVRAKAARQRTA